MREMSGRAGSPNHQYLIRKSSSKLLNEIIGDQFLTIALVREQSLDVKADASISGERLGVHRFLNTEVRLYSDIACVVVFDKDSAYLQNQTPIFEHMLPMIERFKEEGKKDEYYKAVRTAYGAMIYIIECETSPTSNLLRDGPRLTAYRLLKQKNPNFVLILSTFENVKVDHPEIFDHLWRFPRPKKGVSIE